MKTKKSNKLRVITILLALLLMLACAACADDSSGVDGGEESGSVTGNTPGRTESPAESNRTADIVVVLEPSLNLDYSNRTLEFREGLTCVEFRTYEGDSTIGNFFVDTNGNIVIEGDELGFEIKKGGFSSGFALTSEGFIDKEGNILNLLDKLPQVTDTGANANWRVEREFSEGIAVAYSPGFERYSFIDTSGNELFSIGKDEYIRGMSVSAFSEGFALARGSGYNAEYGLIDVNGVFTSLGEYKSVYGFHEGFAWAEKNDGGSTYYLIDTTGQVLFQYPNDFDDAFAEQNYFNEGLMCVVGKYASGLGVGFIGTDGEIVIPATYTSGDDFSEGLVCVGITENGVEKYGYINRDGETVIPFEYDDAKPFSEGFAAVKKNRLWGFIDKQGNVVVDFEYDRVFSFSEGYVWVVKDRQCGILYNQDYTGAQ